MKVAKKTNKRTINSKQTRNRKRSILRRSAVVRYAARGAQGYKGAQSSTKGAEGVQGTKTTAPQPIEYDGKKFLWVGHEFKDKVSGTSYPNGYAMAVIGGGGFAGYEEFGEYKERQAQKQQKQQSAQNNQDERQKLEQSEQPTKAQHARLAHAATRLCNEWSSVFNLVAELKSSGNDEKAARIIDSACEKYGEILKTVSERFGGAGAVKYLTELNGIECADDEARDLDAFVDRRKEDLHEILQTEASAEDVAELFNQRAQAATQKATEQIRNDIDDAKTNNHGVPFRDRFVISDRSTSTESFSRDPSKNSTETREWEVKNQASDEFLKDLEKYRAAYYDELCRVLNRVANLKDAGDKKQVRKVLETAYTRIWETCKDFYENFGGEKALTAMLANYKWKGASALKADLEKEMNAVYKYSADDLRMITLGYREEIEDEDDGPEEIYIGPDENFDGEEVRKTAGNNDEEDEEKDSVPQDDWEEPDYSDDLPPAVAEKKEPRGVDARNYHAQDSDAADLHFTPDEGTGCDIGEQRSVDAPVGKGVEGVVASDAYKQLVKDACDHKVKAASLSNLARGSYDRIYKALFQSMFPGDEDDLCCDLSTIAKLDHYPCKSAVALKKKLVTFINTIGGLRNFKRRPDLKRDYKAIKEAITTLDYDLDVALEPKVQDRTRVSRRTPIDLKLTQLKPTSGETFATDEASEYNRKLAFRKFLDVCDLFRQAKREHLLSWDDSRLIHEYLCKMRLDFSLNRVSGEDILLNLCGQGLKGADVNSGKDIVTQFLERNRKNAEDAPTLIQYSRLVEDLAPNLTRYSQVEKIDPPRLRYSRDFGDSKWVNGVEYRYFPQFEDYGVWRTNRHTGRRFFFRLNNKVGGGSGGTFLKKKTLPNQEKHQNTCCHVKF